MALESKSAGDLKFIECVVELMVLVRSYEIEEVFAY
jgi:hypothetical protein